MSETLPLGEAKAHLSELVSRVGGRHERVAITVHGRPSAVLVAVEDLESLEETIALLSDATVLRALAQSDAELGPGRGGGRGFGGGRDARPPRVGVTRPFVGHPDLPTASGPADGVSRAG
jgi:antitoxin YefM